MTLKSLAGIETPDRGRISVEGKVVYDSARKINWRPQKRKIGYLFQNYALFPNMSVETNIGAGLKKWGKEEKRQRVAEMIRKFRLEGLEKRLPGELSGGQQQRVALARIMACQPEMILGDDPAGRAFFCAGCVFKGPVAAGDGGDACGLSGNCDIGVPQPG